MGEGSFLVFFFFSNALLGLVFLYTPMYHSQLVAGNRKVALLFSFKYSRKKNLFGLERLSSLVSLYGGRGRRRRRRKRIKCGLSEQWQTWSFPNVGRLKIVFWGRKEDFSEKKKLFPKNSQVSCGCCCCCYDVDVDVDDDDRSSTMSLTWSTSDRSRCNQQH